MAVTRRHYFRGTSHANKRIHKRKKKTKIQMCLLYSARTRQKVSFILLFLITFSLSLSLFRSRMFFSCIHTFTTLLSNFECLALPLHVLPQSNGTSLATNLVYFCFEVLCFNIISIKYSQGFWTVFFFTSSIEFFFICICSLSFCLLKSFFFLILYRNIQRTNTISLSFFL